MAELKDKYETLLVRRERSCLHVTRLSDVVSLIELPLRASYELAVVARGSTAGPRGRDAHVVKAVSFVEFARGAAFRAGLFVAIARPV